MSSEHRPLEVTETDGMPFVKCSCDGDNPRNTRWQTAYWLRDHWQGTQVEGVAAIHAVIDRQRKQATPSPAPTAPPQEQA